MVSELPLVLVVGASGHTGQSIVQALLKSEKFRIAATTRPSSVSKPEVDKLRSEGVDIRAADIHSDSVEKLKEVLAGVDILVSAINAKAILDQKPLFAAAKEAGVKRVIPCDFGTPGARGVRDLLDSKLVIQDYIKELGLPFTFIDVGWWMQLITVGTSSAPSALGSLSHEFFENGDKKVLLTDLDHIGTYVARIIADERTLNKSVIVWEDELTQSESVAICERVSGAGDEIRSKRVIVTEKQLFERVTKAKAEYAKNPTEGSHLGWALVQYMISVHFLGENSLANAKALGYLDAQELYPDIIPTKFEEFTRKFYKKSE